MDTHGSSLPSFLRRNAGQKSSFLSSLSEGRWKGALLAPVLPTMESFTVPASDAEWPKEQFLADSREIEDTDAVLEGMPSSFFSATDHISFDPFFCPCSLHVWSN